MGPEHRNILGNFRADELAGLGPALHLSLDLEDVKVPSLFCKLELRQFTTDPTDGYGPQTLIIGSPDNFGPVWMTSIL